MLTSNQVVGAVKAIDAPGLGGIVMSLKRASRNGMNADTLTAAQRQFVDDLQQVQRPARESYQHPGAQIAAPPQVPVADGQGRITAKAADAALTPADVEWLRRLPDDPARVPWDDARALLALPGQVRSASDKRLVDAIAAPVRQWHDEGAAGADLRNAQQPLPQVPASALGALADAIAAEVPQLRPQEAASRAADALDEIGADRVAGRDQWISTAQARLAELATSDANRRAVVK